MKWSDGLRNRVSIIIRRYTDHMKFYCFFHFLLVLLYIIVYMVVCFVCFCLVLCIMYSYNYVYVFLFFYVPFQVFCCIVLFCVLFVCKCVLYCCHRVSIQMQLSNMSYQIIPRFSGVQQQWPEAIMPLFLKTKRLCVNLLPDAGSFKLLGINRHLFG